VIGDQDLKQSLRYVDVSDGSLTPSPLLSRKQLDFKKNHHNKENYIEKQLAVTKKRIPFETLDANNLPSDKLINTPIEKN
jgi:hypothetical protein